MVKLTSKSTYIANGKKCFAVENPFQCDNFEHLIGQKVEIDGNIKTIIGVERKTHSPPWYKGESISVMVNEL